MRINQLPAGRMLVRLNTAESTYGGTIFLPDTARNRRKEEIGEVVAIGSPIWHNGNRLDFAGAVGEKVWVHPNFGDQWRAAEGTKKEIRSYGFHEIRGWVDEEAEDFD